MSSHPHPADRPAAPRHALLDRTVVVGRTGAPKTLGQVLRILLRIFREDVVSAARHYFMVRFAGSYLVPRPLRYLLYRAAGVRLEQGHIAAGVTVAGPPSHLAIGHGTEINVGCFFDLAGRVSIGRGAMFGMQVTVVTSSHPIGDDGLPLPELEVGDVVIGDGVWLGARATILPGVTIGERAVISAGSVVTRDCRPFALYAGVPARMVGDLRKTPTPAPEGPADPAP